MALLLAALAALAGGARAECLRGAGPVPGKLNVHIISHAHDDVGWLKTVDQYFYGQRNDFASAGVTYSLDTIVQALEVDPSRRFTFAEQAFFQRWWREQDDAMQARAKAVHASGQLIFENGG